MYIRDLLSKHSSSISFEVFPPKQESGFDTIVEALFQMTALKPDFISVTYGAGGSGNSGKTTKIAAMIKNEFNTEPLAHLTAITAKREEIANTLSDLKSNGIQNIMALRGDIPVGFKGSPNGDFKYAKDLIAYIKEYGDFCIGGACYPEGHLDCDDIDLNYIHMKEKQQAGADFLVSQLFFENKRYLKFRDKAEKEGITIPLVAGLMPILSKSQVQRMIFTCGVSLPSEIVHILHRFENDPEGLQLAGIEYCCKQIDGLVGEGVKNIHIYSMNKPGIAKACKEKFSSAVKKY